MSELLPSKGMPRSFEATLLDIYGGNVFVPVVHGADKTYQMAALALVKEAKPHKDHGQRTWRTHSLTRQIDGIDVRLALTAGRKLREQANRWWNYDSDASQLRWAAHKTIYLTMNEDRLMPAAVLLPRSDERVSAAIVVGDEINQPDHVQAIQEIITEISPSASTRLESYWSDYASYFEHG